jgi:hypothetical protein
MYIVCFIIALNADRIITLRINVTRQHIISVYTLLTTFFIILNFLNKKQSKVIYMREFEIILFHTQSLSIKPKGSLRLVL